MDTLGDGTRHVERDTATLDAGLADELGASGVDHSGSLQTSWAPNPPDAPAGSDFPGYGVGPAGSVAEGAEGPSITRPPGTRAQLTGRGDDGGDPDKPSLLERAAVWGGNFIAKPHDLFWDLHDRITGPDDNSNLSGIDRSYEALGSTGDLGKLAGGTLLGNAARLPIIRDIPVASWVPGQDWGRSAQDGRITGWDWVDVGGTAAEFLPAGKLIKAGKAGGRTVLPANLGGGYLASTTPYGHVPKLLGQATDADVLRASLDARRQLAETGQAQVEVGGRVYQFGQSRLDQALRGANPGATLSATAAPDVQKFAGGGVVPEFTFPDSRVKPASEQFQFRTPGGGGVLKFSERSAFGNTGSSPGLAVYGDSLDRLSVPGSRAEPLGVNYFGGGRELELGLAAGQEAQPLRSVAGVGDNWSSNLYLADDLEAPSYGARVKANVLSLGDRVAGTGGHRQGWHRGTPEEIAQARFGKELGDLTADEAGYVAKTQASDTDLLRASQGGDNQATAILESRAQIDEITKARDARGVAGDGAAVDQRLTAQAGVGLAGSRDAAGSIDPALADELGADGVDLAGTRGDVDRFAQRDSGLYVPREDALGSSPDAAAPTRDVVSSQGADEDESLYLADPVVVTSPRNDGDAGAPTRDDAGGDVPRDDALGGDPPREEPPPGGEPPRIVPPREEPPPGGEPPPVIVPPREEPPPGGEPPRIVPPREEPPPGGEPPPVIDPPREEPPPGGEPPRIDPPREEPPPGGEPPRIDSPREEPPPGGEPPRIDSPREEPRDGPRLGEPPRNIPRPDDGVRQREERRSDDPLQRTSPRRPFMQPPDGPEERIPAAPRPPGGFPRSIAHRETIEYSYDPTTDQYQAHVVEQSEPVVTGWDDSPASETARDVGAWEVVPARDSVNVQMRRSERDLPVPVGVRALLRHKAEREGGPVTQSRTMQIDHDIDTQTTDARLLRTKEQEAVKKAILEDRRREDVQRGIRRRAKRKDDINKSPTELPGVMVLKDAPSLRGRGW